MKRIIYRCRLVLVVVSAALVSVPASGDVILGQHDWNPGPEGWSATDQSWVAVTDPAGTGDSWLDITFNPTETPSGQEWSTLVKTQAEDLFAGTWTSSMFVEFDFWAEDVTPAALHVEWSSSTNSEVWAYNLTVPSTVGSPSGSPGTAYTVSFSNWEDWLFSGGSASEDQYLSDLSSIDWIGIYIDRNGNGLQSYQLDNFRLMIPEPSQLIMLSSAIVACMASLRRRRKRVGET